MEVNYRISINPRSDLGKVHLVQKTPVTKKNNKILYNTWEVRLVSLTKEADYMAGHVTNHVADHVARMRLIAQFLLPSLIY